MQAVNTGNGKLYDFLPVQAQTKPPPHVKSDKPQVNGSSFKDTVKKVFKDKDEKVAEPVENMTGKLQEATPEDEQAEMQIGELAALLAGANVTVLPFGIEEQQTQQIQLIPEQTPQEPAKQSEEASVMEAGPQEGLIPEQNVVQIAGAYVPETQPAKNGPVQQEAAPNQAQQTNNAGEAKGETVVKEQSQAEKQQTAKNGENEVKFTMVKQEEAKTEKPEQPIFAKPEVKPPDPEKIYVRVGNGQNIDSEKFTKDISGKILTSFSEGKQQVVIELVPQDLGKIIIKLIMQNGRAEIIMQCMNPKTQQLVLTNAEAIRNIVEEGTKMQTTVTVKDEVEEYKDLNDREGQNKRESREGNQDGKLSEAETDMFLHQLRLGLTETLEEKT